MSRSILLRVLLALGIATNVGLLLINLSPERPHLARVKRHTLLLRAGEARIQWLKENELAEFGRLHDVVLDVEGVQDFDEVYDRLVADAAKPKGSGGLLLADLTDEYTDDLRERGAVSPLEDAARPEELAAVLDEALADAAGRGRQEGKVWFLPKRLELDVVGFLRPAVEDAYLHWRDFRPAIEAALAEANGKGLPDGYALERSPDQWDSFDLFVAAWTWAHRPAAWADGTTAPRLAFRTGDWEAALSDLTALLFRHGLDEDDLGKLEGPAVLDALQWHALLRKHHLLAPPCEAKDGIGALGVNDLLRDRKIAWAPIDQPDSLWVHGGARRDADPGMRAPADLAWSVFPRGVSAQLRKGQPARQGRTFSFAEVHMWVLPRRSPDKRLAFELARFLSQRGLQQRETAALGMLPMRKDLQRDHAIVFRLEWMQALLHASYRQIQLGSGDLPADLNEEGPRLLSARDAVLAAPGPPVTLAGLRAVLARIPVEKPSQKAPPLPPEEDDDGE